MPKPDLLFQITSTLAMVGWLALLLSPWRYELAQRIAAVIVPVLLAIVYAGLIALYFRTGAGSFSTLDGVIALFSSREVVLAGWIHYLAFDLLVGAWEVRVAKREQIAFPWVVPCLVFTLMLGPVGFLLFMALRAWHSGARPRTG